MPSKKIEIGDLVAKFKEKNRNREPRDAAELVNFSKKLRGFQQISFGEARKYLQSATASTPKRRRPRPKQAESKEPEEKQQSSVEPPSPQPDASATESDEVDLSPFQVGDEVVLTKERTGIIRFIGPVEFTEGTIFGIELHSQFVGTCDGSKNGKSYFECGPQRGLFVQEKKIRRKMTKSDHARKSSWLAANAERNSRVGRTPSPGPPAIDEERTVDEQEEPQEEAPPDESGPATEEKEEEAASQEIAEENGGDDDDAGGEAIPNGGGEENVNDDEDDNNAPVEEDAMENGDDEEVVQQQDEEQPADDDVDEQEPVVDSVQAEEEKEDVVVEEDDAAPNGDEQLTEEVDVQQQQQQQPPRQSYNLEEDFYPAKAGENLLQFVSNQPDLRLRRQLMDAYMTTSDSSRLEKAFEHLKAFAPDEQNNLLRVDIVPRLADCR